MAFQWVNHSSGTFGSSTTTNVGSSNAAGSNGTFTQGDMLLILLYFDNANITSGMTPPSGWTQAAVGNDSAQSESAYTFYKTAGASETGSYTFSWTGSAGPSWILTDYGQSLAFDVASLNVANFSSTSFTAPSVTTTTSSDLLVWVGAVGSGTLSAVPSTFTSRLNANLNTASDAGGLADKPLSSSGATGTITATAGSTFRTCAAGLIALKASGSSNVWTPAPVRTRFQPEYIYNIRR